MKSLALAFTLAVTATAANLIGSRRPSQEDVVSHFREHRQGYETLREMALADGLSSVIDGGTRFARDLDSPRSPGELGISPEDAAAYRRLLAEAECDRLSVTREGEVLFPVAGWGMASRGWRLSVMWSKREPASLVPSIDGLASTGGRSVASHIEGHWYVHFVW